MIKGEGCTHKFEYISKDFNFIYRGCNCGVFESIPKGDRHMTLEEAKAEYVKDPTKRILRSGNSNGMISVWFTVSPVTGDLMCNTWEVRLDGMELVTRRAAFQESEHNDWITIPA